MRVLLVIGISAALFVSIGLASSSAQMFIYPLEGQSSDKQEMDEFACYKWAKEQTGFDPNQPVAAASAPKQKKGGMLGGAMGGAALGAIGGAIAGNAGKGAAIGAGVGAGAGLLGQSRDNAKTDKKQQQAASQNQQNRQTFNRAYGVCLEGRGYKVG
jgi:predicted lipid-binding transport protein (Tim44 family)